MSVKYRFGAVIPAAGLSSRMGDFKPLLPYNGRSIIESSVDSVMRYVISAVTVVGYRGDEVARVLNKSSDERLKIVINPDYASTDMLRSICIGLRAMGECDAFFLLPADMPLIPDEVYRDLIDAFDGESDVIYPVINGRRGHPPLIRARLIPMILGYEGEGGLRVILADCKIKEVQVTDNGIFTDLDTPHDYHRLITDHWS